MTRHAPRILFRADASPNLGGGHVMRCLALARALCHPMSHEWGTNVAFACCEGTLDAAPALARSNLPVTTARSEADFDFPADWGGRADAIFVDLYTSTRADETRMRDRAGIIAVIEDLPERTHDCDLLVDPMPGGSPFDYAGRVPGDCNIMAGGAFALVRSEFAEQRQRALDRHFNPGPVKRILVSMGLTDLGGISEPVARLALDTLPEASVEVILGPRAPSRPALEALCRTEPRLTVHVDIDDMAQRMAKADLAIGAGGGTALERCVVGLPSIAVVLAGNQQEMTGLLDTDGALAAIASPEDVLAELPGLIRRLERPAARARMAKRAAAVCDGRGAQRVARALVERIERQREAGHEPV